MPMETENEPKKLSSLKEVLKKRSLCLSFALVQVYLVFGTCMFYFLDLVKFGASRVEDCLKTDDRESFNVTAFVRQQLGK